MTSPSQTSPNGQRSVFSSKTHAPAPNTANEGAGADATYFSDIFTAPRLAGITNIHLHQIRHQKEVAMAKEPIIQTPVGRAVGPLNSWDDALNLLKAIYENLVTLEIKTEVTTDQIQCIQTKIDLVQGDITTKIHQSFVKGINVYDFHKEQVSRGEAIIERNVQTVKTMAEGLAELFRK
jgi:hypothetical protein